MSMLFGVGLCWCVYVFLQLKLEYKQDIVRYITKYFAVLLAISLFVFIWSKVGFPFPHQVIRFNDSSAYGTFLNYYFYVQPESMRDGFRFCSIFLEPGHMVMGLAPLLFINRYNIKSIPVFILFLALLASFSLAGYIVTAIGFLWDSFLRGKVKNAIMVTLVFALFLYLVTTFYANDLFDSLILARLQIVDGKLSGNDRMNSYFAAVFEAYVKSPDFMFGKGEFDAEKFHYGHGNSGWQVFAYIYGLVGLILCIIAYLAPAFTHKKKWSLWGFSAILLLLLMGNGYPTWWCMLIHLTIGAYTLTEPSRQS